MKDQSPLRQLVAVAETKLTPPLQELYRSGPFAIVVGTAVRVERSIYQLVASAAGQVWHAVNLPTRQDVTRVRELVAELDQDVRRLQRTLDEAATLDQTPILETAREHSHVRHHAS